MSYRALFAADIHAGNNLPWASKDPETLITDRLLDIIEVLRQMSGYALENEIRDIWIVGDLIDRRLVDAVTLKIVTEELLSIQQLEVSNGRKLRVFMVPGNHEAGDAACKHFTLDAFASMGFRVAGVTDVARGQVSFIEPVDGFEVVAMPYVPAARAEELLTNAPTHLPSLLLIHQTIKGGMVGGWVSPDGLEPGLLEGVAPTILSGHFHSPQSITPNLHYLGAPVQHSFSDVGDERGYWDITWSGNKVKRVKVPVVGAPRFHELVWEVGGEPPGCSAILAKDYVNLTVRGYPEALNKFWKTASNWASELKQEHELRMVKMSEGKLQAAGKQRLVLSDNGERPTWDKVLSTYLDAADCTGLDRQKLEQLGKELMADADK